MPLADSLTAPSTSSSPTMVFRRIGRIEYKVSAMIGPLSPTPIAGIEMKIANKASEGTVSITAANPRIGPRSALTRCTRTPSTTEIAVAKAIDIATNCTCSITRSRMLPHPSACDAQSHQLWYASPSEISAGKLARPVNRTSNPSMRSLFAAVSAKKRYHSNATARTTPAIARHGTDLARCAPSTD